MRNEKQKIFQQNLLKTKYGKPETTSCLIPRDRLYGRLDQALSHRLTVVSAPAGYGKTTAVNAWLEKSGIPYAWVSLDENDDDAVVFWRYVFAALDRIDKDISMEASYVFSSQELLYSNIHLSIMIDRLSDAQSDFVLVLDDFHHITERYILKGLTYLISFLPPKMHIVIVGRTEPGLKLATHAIRGSLTILRSNTLRFRQDEITQFYKARGFNITDEDAREVERYTEGWAAALVAAAMSMAETEDRSKVINGLEGGNTQIFRYLQDEVINSWPEEKTAFAVKTSILDTLCGSLCDAVAGVENGSGLLAAISAGNGFLISLDDDNKWYRHHSLFREFLGRLLDGSKIDKVRLNLKAAEWYEHNGYAEKAIDHYLDAKRHEQAMVLITRQIEGLKNTGDYSKIFAWIKRLPVEFKDDNFAIEVAYTLYYTEAGLFDDAWKRVNKMERLNAGNKAPKQLFRGENKSYIDMLKANLAIRQGNFKAFVSIIEEVSRVIKKKSIKMSGYIDCNLFDIYLARSSMHMLVGLAKENLERYRRFVENYRAMLPKNPGYAPLAVGEYYYESGRFQEALPFLLLAINEAVGAGCPGALIPAVTTIARIKRAQRDIFGALSIVKEYEGWLERQGKPHWIYLINAFKARLYIDSGDMDKAERWFASCKLGVYHEISRVKEYELIVYSRVLMEKGLLRDADILLKRLLIFAEGAPRPHSMVEILNLLAFTAAGIADEEYSMRYIEKALKTGSEEGYVRSFLDELAPMRDLLKKYVAYEKKQDEPAAYAEKLLEYDAGNIRAEKAADSGVSPNLINQLTRRENKVLHLLAAGLSNSEVAEELGISLSTVKYHNVNLFGKLEVKTRLEAVSKAKKLGLLE